MSVPQYEGLGIKEFLNEAEKYPEIERYLPEADEQRKLPRQWVINLVYTLAGKPFADWVLEHIEARNSKLVQQRKMAIDMDPEILRAFTASSHVSSKYIFETFAMCGTCLTLLLFHSSTRRGCPSSQGRVQAPTEAGRHPRPERPGRAESDHDAGARVAHRRARAAVKQR